MAGGAQVARMMLSNTGIATIFYIFQSSVARLQGRQPACYPEQYTGIQSITLAKLVRAPAVHSLFGPPTGPDKPLLV